MNAQEPLCLPIGFEAPHTQNVVLVGGPGTGRTHLATAIGVQAIQHHRQKVCFLSTIELVDALEQEKQAGHH